ncbi:MAG: DJ-1/PfpI family protein [Chloroflexota bacterium]
MAHKKPDPKSVLLVMADGLEETESVGILCKLRQTGLCVKSVGLTSGLVTGAHGISLKPDMTLADFESDTPDVPAVKLIVFTERKHGRSQLETEPRLHHLLRHTLIQGGCVAMNQGGQRIMKAIDVSADQLKAYRENRQILTRDWQQSLDDYIGELIRCSLRPIEHRTTKG